MNLISEQVSIMLNESEEDIKALYNQLPENAILHVGFCIITPDAVLQNETIGIIKFLAEKGIDIIDYKVKQIFSEQEKEEVYRYNLNSGKNTWWFNKEIFSIGPSLGLMIICRDKSVDFFEHIKIVKGKSNPGLADKDSVRGKFNALNTVFNLMHASDDPVSVIREARIFFSNEEIKTNYLKASNMLNNKINNPSNIYEDILNELDCIVSLPGRLSFYEKLYKFKKMSISKIENVSLNLLTNQELKAIEKTINEIRSSYFEIDTVINSSNNDKKIAQALTVNKRDMELNNYKKVLFIFNNRREELHLNEFDLLESFNKEYLIRNTVLLINVLCLITDYRIGKKINFEQVWNVIKENGIYLTDLEKLLLHTGIYYEVENYMRYLLEGNQ